MTEQVETRREIIPPCVISKSLVLEIGKLLEEAGCKGYLNYCLYSKTKTIESKSAEDFVGTEWDPNIDSIEIRVIEGHSNKCPGVEIRMGFSEAKYDERDASYSVSGYDALQVNRITKKLEEAFGENRQKFYAGMRNIPLSLGLMILASVTLTYPVFLVWRRLLWGPLFDSTIGRGVPVYALELLPLVLAAVLMFVAPLVFFVSAHYFIEWRSPYLRYEEYRKNSAEKWIWISLFGAVCVSSLLLTLVGF